jgi:hypothetical protein
MGNKTTEMFDTVEDWFYRNIPKQIAVRTLLAQFAYDSLVAAANSLDRSVGEGGDPLMCAEMIVDHVYSQKP